MTDHEILRGIRKYFSIYELVGRATYRKYGEGAWRFLDIRALHMLLIVREGVGRPITVNDWKWGGRFAQRGLRTNIQQLFWGYFKRKKLYLSAHVLGKGFDFDVEGMSAEDVRRWIIEHAELFPFKVRLEAGVSWVHVDVIQDESKPKVYEFHV